MHRGRWIALAAVALMGGGCASLPKTSADFTEVTKRMDVIALMPPSFSLGEMGAFTGQAATEISHDIEVELGTAAGALIAESRYKRATFDLSDSALAGDAELRTAIFEQNQAINQVFKDLSKVHGKTLSLPYRGSIDLIADRTGAEYLLFMSGSGYFKTGGAVVKGFLLGGLAGGLSGNTQTNLAGILVDGKTGRVVWYNAVEIQDRDPRKPSELMQTAQKLTAPLLGKSKLSPDHSRDQVIIDKLRKMKKA
jgi:hypothetical protein